LWKKSKPYEPAWEAPFGKGRPGWHIEDTAITEKYFGPQYDIHGGAIDLIFPHHEAEITQMESLSRKKPFVRLWMHAGFLNIDSQKMSKSLGNYKTIRSALESYDYRVLRLLFISSHYRTSIDFSESVLVQAKNTLEKIDEFVFRIDHKLDDIENEQLIVNLKYAIEHAMSSDFNSPKAFAIIFDFIKSQNINEKNGRRVWDFFQEMNFFMDIFQLFRKGSSIVRKKILSGQMQFGMSF
jgi:cysteinyl-tRNA synthetase